MEGSHLSGIERDTQMGSSLHGDATRVGTADLRWIEKYGMGGGGGGDPPIRGGPRRLQIEDSREKILNVILNHQVTIVSGHTGCGKTTQIPQYLLHNSAHRRRPVNIIVTQPRRIAAISIATRVAKEMGVPLGSVVGYKVGMDRDYASTETRLLYVTTGVLKKMIISKDCSFKFAYSNNPF